MCSSATRLAAIRMHRRTLALFAASGLMFGLYSPMTAQETAAQTRAMKSSEERSVNIRSRSRNPAHSTWRDYAGASDASQYSSLAQINRSNVGQLQVAWSYPTGDGKYSFNP